MAYADKTEYPKGEQGNLFIPTKPLRSIYVENNTPVAIRQAGSAAGYTYLPLSGLRQAGPALRPRRVNRPALSTMSWAG